MPGLPTTALVGLVALAAVGGFAIGRVTRDDAPEPAAVAERSLTPATVALELPAVPQRVQPLATATPGATPTPARPQATATAAPRATSTAAPSDTGSRPTTIVEE